MYNFKLIKYYNVRSDVHDFNPFYKLICLLLFTLLTLITNNTIILFVLLFFLISLMSLSKISFKLYFKNLYFLAPFIIFIILMNIILRSNILVLLNSLLKLILLVLYSMIVMYTTKSNDLTYGIERLLKPLKIFNIPVSTIAFSLSLSIRFIPIIFEQTEKVIKAEYSRGLNFEGSLKEKLNKLSILIFPIFNLSFKRSDDIANTLEVRLYNPNKEISKYKKYKNFNSDSSIILIHILLLLIYIVLEAFL